MMILMKMVLKCTHHNIRSLYRNMDEIRVLHDNDIHVLALNETLLDVSIHDNELRIQDYDLIRKDRNRNGGGVAIYIQSSISYELVNSEDLYPLGPKFSTPFFVCHGIALQIAKPIFWISMKICICRYF